MNGVLPKDVRFTRPEESAFFDEPWRNSVGVTHMTLDQVIQEAQVKLVSKEELLASYDGVTATSAPPAQPGPKAS